MSKVRRQHFNYVCNFNMKIIGLKGLVKMVNFHDLIGPRREKTYLQGFANNTGADQPVHSNSLNSAFVVRFLESIICKLATCNFSFLLANL